MKLQKTIIALTAFALTSVPITHQVAFASETTSITQALEQSSLFENSDFGVSVKIAKADAQDIAKAEIQLVKDNKILQTILKRTPELNGADFDLLLVKLTDNAGNPLVNIPSEITIKTNSLRGELEEVLFLAEDAEYQTLNFEKTKEAISFVTTKTNEFALVYKKSETAKQMDKQEKLANIVAFSQEKSEEKLSEIVSISSDKSSVKSDTVVAISDETKEQPKPELPQLNLDKVVAEKPKEEPKKEEPKKEEPTPPVDPTPPVVVNPEPVDPTPPIEEPKPEEPKEPEIMSEVGEGVEAETLPEFDLLVDADGDGFTNGTELMFNTDPLNGESVPPLPNTDYERGAYFLNRDSAKAFADNHIAGKDRTYNIIEKTDEKGRTYFDIEFSSIFSTDKESQPEGDGQPTPPEDPETGENIPEPDSNATTPTLPEEPTHPVVDGMTETVQPGSSSEDASEGKIEEISPSLPEMIDAPKEEDTVNP
ncbi:hypothetical protein NHG31_06415 [Aerococcaceae bacterium NML171108]|nr:hypothetical protein [Aerococcaceae bacterium NML171108]